MNIYLIQRGKIRSYEEETKKGIDKILSFDYMGYSEFEWGALPDSLKRIRKRLADYNIRDYDIQGLIVTAFATDEIHSILSSWLNKLSKGKVMLKAPSYFKIDPIGQHTRDTDFWWSIDQDFFVWVKNESFQNRFLSEISHVDKKEVERFSLKRLKNFFVNFFKK